MTPHSTELVRARRSRRVRAPAWSGQERPGAGRPPSPPRKCFRPRAGPSPPARRDTMPFPRHRAGSVARCALLHHVCARECARVGRSVLTAQGPGRGLWGTTCVCTTHTHVRACLCVHGACTCEGCAHVCIMWGGCVCTCDHARRSPSLCCPLSRAHGLLPRGAYVSPPMSPTPGPWGQRPAGGECPSHPPGDQLVWPWGPLPLMRSFSPEGWGGCVFCLGLFLSFGGSY